MKRPHGEDEKHSHKKHRSNQQPQWDSDQSSKAKPGATGRPEHEAASQTNHENAVDQLPPATVGFPPVAPYTPFTVAPGLPPLPEIADPALADAPFTHRSFVGNRAHAHEKTYEQLEFLGDAYIELYASRLIFSRYSHLPVGRQSQLRELLVKNETLVEFSRAYGFQKRVIAASDRMMFSSEEQKGNKGFNKILADVFEAYIAAVEIGHESRGDGDASAVVEKWLTALWAPKLVEYAKKDQTVAALTDPTHGAEADPAKIYNPAAKQELANRITTGGPEVRIDYKKSRDGIELKGDQLGQNKHFVGAYVTGWGYVREFVGEGEGMNKMEAGNWAATNAMHGASKKVVEECEGKTQAFMSEKRRKKEEARKEKLEKKQAMRERIQE